MPLMVKLDEKFHDMLMRNSIVDKSNLELLRKERYDLQDRVRDLEYENKRLRKALKQYGWKDIGK